MNLTNKSKITHEDIHKLINLIGDLKIIKEEALELLEALKQLQYEDEISKCIIEKLEELLNAL